MRPKVYFLATTPDFPQKKKQLPAASGSWILRPLSLLKFPLSVHVHSAKPRRGRGGGVAAEGEWYFGVNKHTRNSTFRPSVSLGPLDYFSAP